MAKFTKTWWGDRFLEALESIMDAGRLSRGRTYVRFKSQPYFHPFDERNAE